VAESLPRTGRAARHPITLKRSIHMLCGLFMFIQYVKELIIRRWENSRRRSPSPRSPLSSPCALRCSIAGRVPRVSSRCARAPLGVLANRSTTTGHQHAQFVSECEHFFNPSTQRFQALANENPNANARRAAPIADSKHSFQACEGETHYERSLNQQHAVDRSGRVLPVPGRCSCDSRKKSPFARSA